MADFHTIRLEENAAGIAILTLARAEKHNALNALMINELLRAADIITKSATIRAVILASEGKSFCAGGDLNWMRDQAEKPVDERVRESMKLATMLRALDDLPVPLIAKVQGNVFGGGVGMMCVADVVIADENIRWGLTETRLGLIPATIGPYVVRRLGEGHARRCFMNAQVFDAQEGSRIGLISETTQAAKLEERAEEEANAFLNCAPGAVTSAKQLVKHLARTTGDQTDHTAKQLAKRWASVECQHGLSAFFDKTAPPWRIKK